MTVPWCSWNLKPIDPYSNWILTRLLLWGLVNRGVTHGPGLSSCPSLSPARLSWNLMGYPIYSSFFSCQVGSWETKSAHANIFLSHNSPLHSHIIFHWLFHLISFRDLILATVENIPNYKLASVDNIFHSIQEHIL